MLAYLRLLVDRERAFPATALPMLSVCVFQRDVVFFELTLNAEGGMERRFIF